MLQLCTCGKPSGSEHQTEELGGMFCNTSSRLGHAWGSTLPRWEIHMRAPRALPATTTAEKAAHEPGKGVQHHPWIVPNR